MESSLNLAQILSRLGRLLRAYPLQALLALIALGVTSTAIDIYAPADAAGLNTLVSVLSLFAQYGVTAAVLRGEGLLDADRRAGRVASYIGFGIVTGLAILLGTIALILPGIYLAARWSVGVPLIIGEGATMGEAMAASVERTRGSIGAIMGMILLCALPWLASLAGTVWLPPELTGSAEAAAQLFALVSNLLLFLGSVLGWYGALAVYMLTRRGENLEQVFA